MNAEEAVLLAQFKKITELMPGVAFDFIMGTLTTERQHEFGQILVDLGELLSYQAEQRRAAIGEGKTAGVVEPNLSLHLPPPTPANPPEEQS